MAGEWAKASICALSSRAEGFPLVLQEAMAAGVPCVSFDCASGPREIVQHEVNGLLVTPESVAGLSAALLRLAARRRPAPPARRGCARLLASSTTPRRSPRAGSPSSSDALARRAGRPRFAALSAVPPRTPPSDPVVERAGITPEQVRAIALTAAVASARATGAEWLVIPPHERESAVVVLPADARHAFLEALADAGLPPWLSLRDPANAGWHERRGHVAELARELQRGRTPVIALEPWPTRPGRSAARGRSAQLRRGRVLGDQRRRAARRAPRRTPTPSGSRSAPRRVDDRGARRRGAHAAGDDRADRRRVHVPDRRRLHLGRRQRPRVEPRPARRGWPAWPARTPPRPPRPASRAVRRGSSRATSCATRCAACTCSRPGSAGSTWSPPARCPTGSTSTTR